MYGVFYTSGLKTVGPLHGMTFNKKTEAEDYADDHRRITRRKLFVAHSDGKNPATASTQTKVNTNNEDFGVVRTGLGINECEELSATADVVKYIGKKYGLEFVVFAIGDDGIIFEEFITEELDERN
jgi:hypothetical protein